MAKWWILGFRFKSGRRGIGPGRQDRERGRRRRRGRLRGGRDQRGGGVGGRVVEVDFFDEADGQLIVGEPDVLAGVNAGSAVLAHPPERKRPENGDRSIGGDAGG